MSGATIRAAVLADAPRILEIYAYYVERTAVSFEYEVPALAEFEERMRGVMRRYPYLVAEVDGRVLGYAYAGPFASRAAYSWACETTIYLDRNARGRGIGRMLYKELERELQGMGILDLCACIAWSEAEDQYLTRDSARFHARMGFVEVGRFRKCGYKFGRWYDMIWMEKTVGEHVAEQPPVRFLG